MQTGSLDHLDQCLDGLRDAEIRLRTAQAQKLKVVQQILRSMGGDLSSIDGDAAIAEVACLLHVSHRSAQRLTDDALEICEREHVFEALERGDIDLTRAKIIARLLPTSALQEEFEDYAIFYAMDHTAHETKRWILANLPEEQEDAERKSEYDKRSVGVEHHSNGMSEFWAYLPTPTAETFFGALDALARAQSDPDDTRTMEQRRADAVDDLLAEKVAVSTNVSVILPVNEQNATVNGVPIPYSTAWQVALANADKWSTFLAGSDGRITAETPTRYRIPASVARVVRARDQHCRFPGCHVPAARCDLDHTVPFPEGLTTAANLHCLCRRHHRLKHQSGWTVRELGANHLEWTSPAGRTYVTKPPDVFTPGG
jgi:hypothetical protein